MFFSFFMALFVIFLNLLQWNLPNFLQHIALNGMQILNMKKVRFVKVVFFRFFQIYVFYSCQKTGPIDCPRKRDLIKVKYLLTVCQILWNFTEGNSRKFTVSFAFFAHVDVIKYRKTLTFPFKHAQITWTFVPSAHAIVEL